MRYHSGGIAGLKPDEVPAVLKRGEEVLTARDPRHRNNAGGGDSKSVSFALAIGDKEVAKAMSGAAGDEVHLKWLKRNSETVRQLIKG